MEIVLLQDGKALGKKGERVKVSDGYARNYILPKKLGVEANAANLNNLKLQQAHAEKKAQEQLDAAKELAVKIENSPLVLSVKVGEGGKVFGSISTKEIAKAFSDKYGMELDKKKMQMDEPIKMLGTYEVAVKLHKDVTAKLKVQVTEQ